MPLSGSPVELVLDLEQVVRGVDGEVAALGEVLAQQPVGASMSSGVLASGDLVCPYRLVGLHGAVDDVDKVSLEDATGTAGALGRLVTRQQFLGPGRIVSARWRRCRRCCSGGDCLLGAGGGVLGPRNRRDWSAAGVAGEFGGAGEAGDIADLGDQHGCGRVADPGDLQQGGARGLTNSLMVTSSSRTRSLRTASSVSMSCNV